MSTGGRMTVSAELVEAMRERAPRITVIGDLILDGWWQGRSERMSREAPAPVVEITERRYSPGGAANTAANLAALGAEVSLVGVVGDDANGGRLLTLLQECGVDVSDVLVSRTTPTVTKVRVSGSDQVLLRIDDVPPAGYGADDLRELARRAVAATSGAELEVICDYDSGALAGPLTDALVSRDTRPALTIVDAHDLDRWAALRPDIVTPNAAEAQRLIGSSFSGSPLTGSSSSSDRAAAVVAASDRLIAASGAAAVVVTLDRDGSMTVDADGLARRTHAHPTDETRASGAGDTFVAALAMGRACGLGLVESVDLAQAAADVVVQRPGTSICSSADLVTRLGNGHDLTIDADDLEAVLGRHRESGARIVFTNGCFDVLHRGHTGYLRQAKLLGDVLVVALNDDDSVRRLKGPSRPVNKAGDRATVLAALGCVDYVTVFETDTPIPLIERIRPDVYAKGGDYTPEMLEETGVVRAYGGQVVILDYLPSQSTTAIVERIRASAVPDPRDSADIEPR